MLVPNHDGKGRTRCLPYSDTLLIEQVKHDNSYLVFSEPTQGRLGAPVNPITLSCSFR